MDINGRDREVKHLRSLLRSNKSSFLGVTGRRRIGKTFLIDAVCKRNLVFSLTGIKDGSIEQQLRNFIDKLNAYSKKDIVAPQNWQEAFLLLKKYLTKSRSKKKQVIFIDELPWIATARSGFLQLLAHLWNDYLSKEHKYILVICGSSTSWITQKVYNDRGGLHNRVTDKINLQPFSLSESKQFLKSKGVKLTDNAIAELYMICGGIPYYLDAIKKGESPTTAIERLCFTKDGILYAEYDNLFKALYTTASDHEAIVKTLAKGRQGLTRKELLSKSKVEAGGPFTRAMKDLILSGFVEEQIPYGKKKRGATYRLIDEYSIFYHRFIASNKKLTKGLWQQLSAKQTYKIWKGYAFENLCLRQVEEIKNALGIPAIYTEISSYKQPRTKQIKGFQIDLIIDRADNTINLCECKFYDSNFTISKSFADILRKRKAAFIEATGTKKIVYTTLITNYPIVENMYSKEVVDSLVTLKELF